MDEKNLAPPFLKKAPPLKNKGGALAPPFRKKRVVACSMPLLIFPVMAEVFYFRLHA